MMMKDAYELGFATDEEMREFDEGCLVHEAEGADAAPPKTGGAKKRSRKSAANAITTAR
jgi:hypothetical protein